MKVGAIICHHCGRKNCVRRHGRARSGLQRYYCSGCGRTFQISYIYQGNEGNILRQIEALSEKGKTQMEICRSLGITAMVLDRYLYLISIENKTC
ncbi:hypothetical protein KV701_03635 [Limnobaculum sp. M2-1]|uniref:IS1/IS1595 family N-terminal zinc-binding domain-containing protein n=1 Tax=Limnobaculum sp. M2-1 TaxID=2855838 RepID=UPI001C46EBB7|nr:hypothetical protein [Limnobaculum sp. M2-1]MBV7690854.1 hypothetical protein [Limnobaculum sp. M2-1]